MVQAPAFRAHVIFAVDYACVSNDNSSSTKLITTNACGSSCLCSTVAIFGLQLVHPHPTPKRFSLSCAAIFVCSLCCFCASSLQASLILQTGSRCTSFWTGANIGFGNNLSPRIRPDARSPGEWVTFTRKLLDSQSTTSFGHQSSP